jgi:protein MBA1
MQTFRGNVPEIRRFCCERLSARLVRQIEARDASEKLEWTLVKYLRKPSTNFLGLRVMSDRATSIPELANSGIRQIVVRVTSRQSMATSKVEQAKRGAQPVETLVSTKEQDCVEYIVVQNLRWNGKDNGWMLWGHVTPTTMQQVMEDPYFAPGLSAMERMEQIKEAMMSGSSGPKK